MLTAFGCERKENRLRQIDKNKTAWAGKTLIYKEETDSTNADAFRMADELVHGAVIMADSQFAGRGRRGRTWVSKAGENLYFSLLLKPDFEPDKAPMLTLVMALAAAKGIEALYGCKPQIKWPNDIVINGKKVCGILTEMQAAVKKIKYVVIGVGINVNQKEFAGEALAFAGSLLQETGQLLERKDLLSEVLSQFEDLYESFCRERTLGFMLSDYENRLANLNKEVQVLDPKGVYQGTALGMNDKGELLVQKQDGTLEAIYAGEVSVRGLFGYV